MILSYLGSKASLMHHIIAIMHDYIKPDTKFCDLFSGSGVVSHFYAGQCKNVITCDQEIYAYVLAFALTQCPYTNKIKSVIIDLNKARDNKKDGLVAKHFAPPSRMFFTVENAQRIDFCRCHITKLYHSNNITYKEFIFLLASLLCSSSKIANTCGTFRAYLKHFSMKATKQFSLIPVHTKKSLVNKLGSVVCSDAITCVKRKGPFDVTYIDPPYNGIHYGAYYSFLNYLCQYNSDIVLEGTGICEDYNKSSFGMKKHSQQAFHELFSSLSSNQIFLSYSSKGVLTLEQIVDTIRKTKYKCSKIKVYEIIHKAYRPQRNCKHKSIIEYIIHIDSTNPKSGEVGFEKLCY
jgi:adenine-specific DNA-methyltransferase